MQTSSKPQRMLLVMLCVIAIMLSTACAASKEQIKPPQPGRELPRVKPGIENIDKYASLFTGMRVGLITNQTGVDSNLKSTVDILYEKTKLVALFSPEHGIRGTADAGAAVGTAVDARTKLPVYSLYGATKKPTAKMLEDVDILCFDIQDVGARFYTYMYTMAYAMQSCKEQDKTFVVFDRPNPIGGEQVEGPVLKAGYKSFIGLYPIPIRHGLTIGELARLFNEEFGIGCKLVVIPMEGWHRSMYWQDTGLPWVMTSPNIPTPDTALVYPGIGLFGDTNVSEGVGTTRPFEMVGSHWLDAFKLADKMNSLKLPGVIFRPTGFKLRFGYHSGQDMNGVQIHVIDKKSYQPVQTAVRLLAVIREMGGDEFVFRKPSSFDLAVGENSLRQQSDTLDNLIARWAEEAQHFKELSRKYYLYQ